MMKKSIAFCVIMSGLCSVFALTPAVSFTPTGDGNTVTVGVTGGDANQNVTLVYPSTQNTLMQSQSIGSTDASGNASISIKTITYSIATTSNAYVIVNGNQSNTSVWPYALQSIALSSTSLAISPGQASTVTVTGMGQFSIAGISNNAVVQVSLTGSLLTLTGLTPGTSSVTVCQVGSQCAVTSVNVVATTTAPTAQTVLAVPVALGGSISIPISGSAAPYYVTQLTTGFLNASVLGNVLTVNGVAQGTSPLTVCSVNGGCSSLTFVVVPQLNASAPVILPAATLASAMNGVALVFSRAMAAGEESDDVMTLQKKLHDEGFFNGTYSRKYGSLTMTAVKKYQKAHGLTQTGNVGPSTRAALNK